MPATSSDNPTTLGEMARRYLENLAPEKRDSAAAEVQQFVRWFGSDRRLDDSCIPEVGNFSDQISVSVVEPAKRLQPVKDFLTYAHRHKWTPSNLSVHLKPRKTGKTASSGKVVTTNSTITLTEQGYAELSAELARLIAERPAIAEELQKARADRDFRENAPLDAAREHQAQVEARIRELEATIKSAAVVSETQPARSKISIGDAVTICDLSSGNEVCYTLVSSREANPMKGKISNESPTGKSLIGKIEGDIIEVTAPAGVVRYKVTKVTQRGANSI